MIAGTLRCFLIVVLAVSQRASGQPPPGDGPVPRRDALGDPLPVGAVARLGTIRLTHAGSVSAVTFAPDGRLLASTGQDGAVRLWETATGKPVRHWPAHRNLA